MAINNPVCLNCGAVFEGAEIAKNIEVKFQEHKETIIKCAHCQTPQAYWLEVEFTVRYKTVQGEQNGT
jgi:transcription initiation factor TFIIIB Brf1 subunit/transcription initiation factor TFIIB